MRFLHRDATPPACLRKYRHGVHQWSLHSPTPPERNDIWAKLNNMQGSRCAYCEADLGKGRHIEHFRQRNHNRYPQETFEWTNLFGSCNRSDTCGKHKDGLGNYNDADLIKPDVEDPEIFLLFAADGTIHPRAGLNGAERHKAEETIRIFNLNGAALAQTRRVLLLHYMDNAEALASLARELGVAEVLKILEDELQSIAQEPHATAIKHLLTRQSPR